MRKRSALLWAAGLSACALAAPLLIRSAPAVNSAPRKPSAPSSPATPSATAGLDVPAENALPGAQGWRPSSTRLKTPGLEAYADRVSVLPGESFGLRIDARGPVQIDVLRMGWYGGARARLVHTQTVQATRQPPFTMARADVPGWGRSAVWASAAGWKDTTRLDTAGWPQGHYLLRLTQGAASRLVPVTVRTPSAKYRVVMVNATMTWQAYNLWGGKSLYRSESGGRGSYDERSLVVTYDRPYLEGGGSGKYLSHDGPVVSVAESLDLPLAWVTDVDVAQDPHLLDGAAAVVFGGHAEYWTGQMRQQVLAAANRGTNVAVFGANTAYWRARLAGPNAQGDPRILVEPKDASLDPLAASDPVGATARFRSPPAAVQETTLAGVEYDCFPAEAPYVVADASWWAYRDAHVRLGQHIQGLIGPESDRPRAQGAPGEKRQPVSYVSFDCGGRRSVQASLYRTVPSGAATFAAGTMRWPCAIFAECSQVKDPAGAVMTRAVTAALLTAFAQPKAGLRHPASDTASRFALPGASHIS